MLLDRLRHVDLVVAQHAHAHHAVLELAADGVGRIEQTLHAFDQTRVGGRVHGRVARRHHGGGFVQLLLALEQHQRGGRDVAGGADRLEDRLVGVGHIRIDAGRELRNTRLQHALCEVVELHGEFGRREVHTDVLLAGNRQRGELLVVVLHLERSAIGHQRTVGQTDAEGGADLRAFDGEAVVVLAVDVAGEDEVVLKDLQGLPGDHVDSKKRVCHLEGSLAVACGFPLFDLAQAVGLNPLRRRHVFDGTGVRRVIAGRRRGASRHRSNRGRSG